MKIKRISSAFLLGASLFFTVSISSAQNFDSTGGNRLWITPSAPGIDIPGYGIYPEGAIVKRALISGNKCGSAPGTTYVGLCLVDTAGRYPTVDELYPYMGEYFKKPFRLACPAKTVWFMVDSYLGQDMCPGGGG